MAQLFSYQAHENHSLLFLKGFVIRIYKGKSEGGLRRLPCPLLPIHET